MNPNKHKDLSGHRRHGELVRPDGREIDDHRLDARDDSAGFGGGGEGCK